MHHHDTSMQLATIRQRELLHGAALSRIARTARTARRAARRNQRPTA